MASGERMHRSKSESTMWPDLRRRTWQPAIERAKVSPTAEDVDSVWSRPHSPPSRRQPVCRGSSKMSRGRTFSGFRSRWSSANSTSAAKKRATLRFRPELCRRVVRKSPPSQSCA
eukprot:scaffold2926_cov399-Prasinococcus_capsulatus_cf.AAC.18